MKDPICCEHMGLTWLNHQLFQNQRVCFMMKPMMFNHVDPWCLKLMVKHDGSNAWWLMTNIGLLATSCSLAGVYVETCWRFGFYVSWVFLTTRLSNDSRDMWLHSIVQVVGRTLAMFLARKGRVLSMGLWKKASTRQVHAPKIRWCIMKHYIRIIKLYCHWCRYHQLRVILMLRMW